MQRESATPGPWATSHGLADTSGLIDQIIDCAPVGMAVIDVSEQGDWSAVKVAYDPGKYGRVYPISGFIYPQPLPGAMMAGAETAEDATVVVSTSGAL